MMEVSENDFLIAVLDYLRKNYPKDECVLYETIKNDKVTSEKPAAVLAIIRNPEMVNHYNKIITRKI